MKANKLAWSGLLLALVFPAGLHAQAEEQNIILLSRQIGLVAAHPDGTEDTAPYAVPQDQELCVTDIVWRATGNPNTTATIGLFNRNTGVETGGYWLWRVDPTLNASGVASGTVSFRAGPRITTAGGLNLSSDALSGLSLTLYGIERPSSATEGTAPTLCFP